MKQYKTVIVDGRKLIRRTMVVLIIGCTLILLIAGMRTHVVKSARWWNPREILVETVPIIEGIRPNDNRSFGSKGRALLFFFLQFDLWEPTTVLAAEVPLTEAVNRTGRVRFVRKQTVEEPVLQEPAEREEPSVALTEIPLERQAPIREVHGEQKPKGTTRVVLGNETSYQVDPEELLSAKPSIKMEGKGPKVLIIHTHATEAYAPEGSTVYDIQGNDRSEDCRKNVVKVGETLVQVLEERGIEVIHDTQLHDVPSFNGSYASSLKAIEEYLKQYPSIQVVLDIHRDSIVYEDGTKAKLITEIKGKKAAQLMFVVGTDQKGLEHPNWKENIKSAVHFQNAICKKYPTLMRHINLRRERFNGHTSKASMIIEVGSSGNSLSEATYGITLAGECIADYLNSL